MCALTTRGPPSVAPPRLHWTRRLRALQLVVGGRQGVPCSHRSIACGSPITYASRYSGCDLPRPFCSVCLSRGGSHALCGTQASTTTGCNPLGSMHFCFWVTDTRPHFTVKVRAQSLLRPARTPSMRSVLALTCVDARSHAFLLPTTAPPSNSIPRVQAMAPPMTFVASAPLVRRTGAGRSTLDVTRRPLSWLPARAVRRTLSAAKVSMADESLNELLANNLEWSKNMTDQDPKYFTQHVAGQTPKYLWIGCTFALSLIFLAPSHAHLAITVRGCVCLAHHMSLSHGNCACTHICCCHHARGRCLTNAMLFS